MRLGLFLPNWIGDVVMTTPAIRALRKMVGEDGELVGIMRPYVAEVLAGTTWLDDRILYDKPSTWLSVASPNVYTRLREAKLDRVVLFTNSLRTAWMAWRSGARERIGHVGEGRSWLLTNRLARPSTQPESLVTTINAHLLVSEAAGARPEPPRLELATTAADEQAADDVWRRFSLPTGRQVVVLNSGGAYGAAKSWPARHFADLARRIVADPSMYVLINSGPNERGMVREIHSLANHPRVVSLAGLEQVPIGLTKACIKRSRMLVTTDSGPRFFAIAFGKPVVTLYGPTNPAATASEYDDETNITLSLECQPCMARVCPLGHHRCMQELTTDLVYPAVRKQLEATAAENAA
jgi:heptosyltransferase II